MGYFYHLLFFAFYDFILLCSATRVLPRAQHAVPESEAFVELHNILLRPRSNPNARNAPIPRIGNHASIAHGDLTSDSTLAAIKRTLLGTRQLTCDPGYAICNASRLCCPDDGNGRCCDDGTCTTTAQTCCTNGGACDPGLKCCGTFTCAPEGGECCKDGESCDPGLHCVILNGVRGCCQDLSCTEFGGSGGAVSALPSFTFTPVSFTPVSFTPVSFTPVSFTPISITPLTFPSFTPISFAPPTFPSITPLSITFSSITTFSYPSITIPTSADSTYSYYTTTWSFTYISFFLTSEPPSFLITIPTSTPITTTTAFSVYATDTVDASVQFASITSAAAGALPTAVTAPGFSTGTGSKGTGTASAKAGGGAVTTGMGSGGGTSQAKSGGPGKGGDQRVVLLLGSCLGVAIGLLAAWL